MSSPARTAIPLLLLGALGACASSPAAAPDESQRATIRAADGSYEGFDVTSTSLPAPALPGLAAPGLAAPGLAAPDVAAPDVAAADVAVPAPPLDAPPWSPADASTAPESALAPRLVPSTSGTRVIADEDREAVLEAARRARAQYEAALRQQVADGGETDLAAAPPATTTAPLPAGVPDELAPRPGPMGAVLPRTDVAPPTGELVPLTPLLTSAPAPASEPPALDPEPEPALDPEPMPDTGQALDPVPGGTGQGLEAEPERGDPWTAAIVPLPSVAPPPSSSSAPVAWPPAATSAPVAPAVAPPAVTFAAQHAAPSGGVPGLVSPARPLPAAAAPTLVPSPVEYRPAQAPSIATPVVPPAPAPTVARDLPSRLPASTTPSRLPAPATTAPAVGSARWEPQLPNVSVPPARGAADAPPVAPGSSVLPEPVRYDVQSTPAAAIVPTSPAFDSGWRGAPATPVSSLAGTPGVRTPLPDTTAATPVGARAGAHPELPDVVVPPVLGASATEWERGLPTAPTIAPRGTLPAAVPVAAPSSPAVASGAGAERPPLPAPTLTAAPLAPLGTADVAAVPAPRTVPDVGRASSPRTETHGASTRDLADRLEGSLTMLSDEVLPQARQVHAALEDAVERLSPPTVLSSIEVGLRDWGTEEKLGFQKSIDDLFHEAVARLEALYDYAITTAHARARAIAPPPSELDAGPTGTVALDSAIESFEEVLRQELGIEELEVLGDQMRGLQTELTQTFSTFADEDAERQLGGRVLLYVGRDERDSSPRCVLAFRDDAGRRIEDLSIVQAVRHRVMRGESVAYDLGWRPDPARQRPGQPRTEVRPPYLVATAVEPRLNRDAPSFAELRDMRVVVDVQSALFEGRQPGQRRLLGGVDWRIVFEVSRLGDVTWDIAGRPVFDAWCSEVVREIEGVR